MRALEQRVGLCEALPPARPWVVGSATLEAIWRRLARGAEAVAGRPIAWWLPREAGISRSHQASP